MGSVLGLRSAPVITWIADADSISSPGQRAVLSDPVEGMTPEDYFRIMERFVRERPVDASRFEVQRAALDLPDGRIREVVNIEIAGVAAAVPGSAKATLHNVYHFRPNEGEWTAEYFYGDASLKSVTLRVLVKVHRNPFRLECIGDEFETRKSGPMLQCLVQARLESLGYRVDVHADAPSPSTPGERSIVSAEISDPDLTLGSFWEKMTAQMEREGNGTLRPDGAMEVQSSAMGGASRWSLEGGDCVKSVDFGYDADDAKALSFWKVHEGPKRIEVWAMSVPGRRSGEGMEKLVEEMHAAALRMSAERSV